MSVEEKMNSKFEIYINETTLSDIDDILKIEASAYGEHHWSRDSFVSEINNKIATYYSVRISTGELVAYIGIWNIVDEAHITTLAVSNNFKRKHIAEALIAKMLEDCYNNYIKYITLEVRASNIAAIKLYEKYGFKSLGVRKGYYQDNNEDALIMWTENIFSDKYKELYLSNAKNIEEYLLIK